MRKGWTWILVASAGALAAGCAGEDGPEAPTSSTPAPTSPTPLPFEDPNHPCVVRGDPAREYAPDVEGRPWVLGQAWDFVLNVDGAARSTRLVYFEDRDEGQHYMIGTATRAEALEHAVHSLNPMIGRIHQALYSPHESGDHADMFHFPLCDGLEWSTVFYATHFAMNATATHVDAPGLGPRPGYVIQGLGADGSRLLIHYALDAQWFTVLDVQRADGLNVRMDMQAMGLRHTGPAHFLRGQKDASVAIASPVVANTTTVAREDGSEGAYESIGLLIDLRRASGTGHARVEVAAPNGTIMAAAEVGDLAGASEASALLEIPYAAGNWTVRQVTLPPAGPLPGIVIEGEVRFVSVYDRGGTVG